MSAPSRDLSHIAARLPLARPSRCGAMRAALVEALHAAGCALPCARVRPCGARDFRRWPPAGRRFGDAPARFRRCHDGWPDFF
ncbi:putative pectate lyase 8 [Dorcoceras hygrometricum]|uniref:Putative pectate lyase 8 n=1 Tax=Dorcoceras hygrometricum TaxID=472368 RepID=A0A2Z6ZU07_9LAMI|nr:putative pectate lyase 8 [Dorcoceras hygrometricum]